MALERGYWVVHKITVHELGDVSIPLRSFDGPYNTLNDAFLALSRFTGGAPTEGAHEIWDLD